VGDYKPSASKWASTSNMTYGRDDVTPALARAQNEIDSITFDTAPLMGDLQTAAPMTDISTSAYYHGPMPDHAIKQHFLHLKSSSSIVDGSGNIQVVEVPRESAEPGFYYLRDADGSRKTLEVRDPSEVAPPPKSESVGGMPRPYATGNPAVPFSGCTSTYSAFFKDPQRELDKTSKKVSDIREGRMEASMRGEVYGETHRITVPKVFRHTMGVPTTDRKTELKMRTMVRDPNPPRATHCTADKLIYSTAPDQISSG